MFEPKKTCTQCREHKSAIHDFDPRSGKCRSCKNRNTADRWNSDPEYKARHAPRNAVRATVRKAKNRAAEKNIPFDLDQHLSAILRRFQAGVCELSGVRFAPFVRGSNRPEWNSPSIDRIEPELGYVYSNIRIICHALNTAIGHWGEDQTAVLMEAWLKKRAKA